MTTSLDSLSGMITNVLGVKVGKAKSITLQVFIDLTNSVRCGIMNSEDKYVLFVPDEEETF